MAINLKQIWLSDTNNEKLDKVNYNFDQLVANGGGPQGVQGTFGLTGYQGVTGYQGNQGSLGDQGAVGAQGDSGQGIWKQNGGLPGDTTKTLLPAHDNQLHINAPTVAIGYKSDSDFYQNGVEDKASLLLNRGTLLQNNLELKTEGSEDAFYYKLETSTINNNTTATMTTGFRSALNAVLKQYATEFQWISEDPNAVIPLISLDGTRLQVNVNADFNSPVTINNTLKISGTATPPADGKIAVSSDAEGTVDFKTIEEIGGVVPLGTIVSVDPLFFSTNFILNEINVESGGDETSVEFRIGSGINNFAGWYLCNGKEWTDGTSLNYVTEDLNSFSYTIEDNPDSINNNSQGSSSQTESGTIRLIAGSSVTMDASFISPNYNISGSVDTDSGSLGPSTSGSTFIVKKLPQIVYLGTENLYWKEKGTNQAPTTTAFYNFVDQIGVIDTKTSTVTASSGSSSYFNLTIVAPSGYHWDPNNIPTIIVPNNTYTINTMGLTGTPGFEENLNIYVAYTSHPNTNVTLDFTYDSSGSIIQTPAVETFKFTFTDTDGIVPIKEISESNTNGQPGGFYVSILALDGQYWTSMPTINTPGGPEGYSISNPSLDDPDGDGYTQVWQFNLDYDSFPYDGPVNFNYSSASALDAIPVVDQTYTATDATPGAKWSTDPISKIVSALPGEPVVFGPFVVDVVSGYYFTPTYSPAISTSRYNNGQNARQSNITIDSWEVTGNVTYQDNMGTSFTRPGQLTIYFKDDNFADGAPAGLSTPTSIFLSISTEEIPSIQIAPYVTNEMLDTPNWSTNYAMFDDVDNRTWKLTNPTSNTIYVKPHVSNGTSSYVSTSGSYYNVIGGSRLATFNASAPSNNSSLPSSYVEIPSNSSIWVVWESLTYQDTSYFVITLQFTADQTKASSININDFRPLVSRQTATE